MDITGNLFYNALENQQMSVKEIAATIAALELQIKALRRQLNKAPRREIIKAETWATSRLIPFLTGTVQGATLMLKWSAIFLWKTDAVLSAVFKSEANMAKELARQQWMISKGLATANDYRPFASPAH